MLKRYVGIVWIQLAQDRIHRWSFVTMVMKFQGLQDTGYSLTGYATTSCSRTVLYGIIYIVGKLKIKWITGLVCM